MAPSRVDASDARIGWAAYAVLGLAHLAVIWRQDYLASLDGPVHVYVAAVLAAWQEPAAATLRQYFELNPGPHPNLLIYGLLYGLMQAVPPAAAEKLLVSGYVLALPLAVRYAAGALTPTPWLAVLLAWPLALALPLMLGFYNYAYGLLVVCVGFGLYLRAAAAPGTGRFLALGLLGLAAFFTHIFAALALLAMVGAAALWHAAVAVRRGDNMLQAGKQRLLPPAVVLLATALLVLHFAATNTTPPSPLLDDDSLVYRLLLLSFSGFLWSLSSTDAYWGAGLLALLMLGLYHHLRVRRERAEPGDHAPLAVALALTLLFLAVPAAAGGGGWMLHRLQPYLYLAFALWLGSRAMRSRFRQALSVALLLFTLGICLWRLPQLDQVARFREAYLKLLDGIEAEDTVMALIVGPMLAPDGTPAPDWRNHPLHHLMAYPAAARRATVIGLYQLHTDVFPIRYRPGMDPFDFRVPPRPGGNPALHRLTDLGLYNELPGRRVDWVLLLGRLEASEVHAIDNLKACLAMEYRQVETVAQPGPFRLYRLQPASEIKCAPGQR